MRYSVFPMAVVVASVWLRISLVQDVGMRQICFICWDGHSSSYSWCGVRSTLATAKSTRLLVITINFSSKNPWVCWGHLFIAFLCMGAHTHASASAGLYANTPTEGSNLCKNHINSSKSKNLDSSHIIIYYSLPKLLHQILPNFSSSQARIMFASDSFSCETTAVRYRGSPAPWKPGQQLMTRLVWAPLMPLQK